MVTMSGGGPPQPGASGDVFEGAVIKMVDDFSQAVSTGDLVKVRDLATELGKMKPKIDLVVIKERAESIWITVTLQRRGQNRGQIRLHVSPNITFLHLKHLMEQQHKLPLNVQRWIYLRHLPKDDVTLRSLGVTDGSVLGLYIMSDGFACVPSTPSEIVIPEAPPPPPVGGVPPLPAAPPAGPAQRPVAPPPPLPVQFVPVNPPVVQPVKEVQWECKSCTFLNEATRPSCEICLTDRPDDFVVPVDYHPSQEEQRRLAEEARMTTLFNQTQQAEEAAQFAYIAENLQTIRRNDNLNYIPTQAAFECPVCYIEVEEGEGVVLRECLHEFCAPCLAETIKNSEGADVKCPFADNDYQCDASLQDREIAGLVSPDEYQKYLNRGIRIAEGREKNSFHCKTANCQGWCIYEDEVNFFTCPICQHVNCLTCKVIHEGQNCKDYQEDIKRRAEIDGELKSTMDGIKAMLDRGEAMNCPSCGVLLQKKEGCDWMRCSMCMTELCWATRGARWGPRGNGDTSAGCRCGMNGRRCAPNCQNCH